MSLKLENGGQNRLESTIQARLEAQSPAITAGAIAKRTLDLFGALFGIILLSPIWLTVALLIKIQEPAGPVLFRQDRIGRHMRPFKIVKFRSMVINAEERLRADPALYRKYITNNYKLEPEEDPRITKLGRFLRKSSLDELPQLLNVLTGQMSLVGPRPVVREELREYGDRMMELLSVKPGVTGYWQVSGRSSVGYPERADLELYYVKHKSGWLDIKIIVLTVWHVLLKKGAY